MTKAANQQRKSKTSAKNQKIKTLNKTDVKLLSFDIYVGILLSKMATKSFKPSSIAH